MKIFKILYILVTISFSISAQVKDDTRLEVLDSLISNILQEWNIPGCAVTVVEKEEVIYTRGFGLRELNTRKLVDEYTVFPIASCTKAFTSALIGLLADEGKIDIDEPATNYLPNIRFSDPVMTLLVTPRDMLTHTTGIPRHDNSRYGFENVPRDSLVKLIRYFEKSADLREKFQYNNYMYTALGAMAEHISNGNSWESQIKERFFKPLIMNESSISYKELLNTENKAFPHEVSFDMEPLRTSFINEDNMGPCGSINSSAHDISKWLLAWVNGGEYNDKVIIPRNFYKEAISTQWSSHSAPSNRIQNLGYGLGWNLAIYRNHYSVFHGGNMSGFASLILFLPSDSIGMAIFINSRTSPVPMVIANSITDRLLGLSSIDWSKNQLRSFIDEQRELKDQFFSKHPSEYLRTHCIKDYCGIYANPGYGRIRIFQAGDTLCGNYGKMKIWLKHFDYDAFSAIIYRSDDLLGQVDVLNRPAVFHQNSEGEISEITILLERRVDPIIFKKVSK